MNEMYENKKRIGQAKIQIADLSVAECMPSPLVHGNPPLDK